MLESGEILWVKETDDETEIPTLTIEYSNDNGEHWTSIASTESGTPISVSAGDKVMFKGTNDRYGINEDWWWCAAYFSGAPSFNMFGNIMSLCYGDNFATATTLKADWTFTAIFNGTNVVDAGNLILPATTLLDGCYDEMFYSCTGLTTPPVLPATTLAYYCYCYMFHGCTSLTSTPALPATMLAEGCYQYMFAYCTSLTTTPELPATTLANHCYEYMFYDCTSLTTAPELPATTLIGSCYRNMFRGCTSLTTAPELPATTLTDNCYAYMFEGCTSLNYVKCLATSNINTASSTHFWLYDVASNGTFVKSPNANVSQNSSGSNDTWPRFPTGIPEGWTVVDA